MIQPGEPRSPRLYDDVTNHIQVTVKLWHSYHAGLTPNINDSFTSIGCLKDDTHAILLSLQRIPFANDRGHFGQYLRQVKNMGIQDTDGVQVELTESPRRNSLPWASWLLPGELLTMIRATSVTIYNVEYHWLSSGLK